MCADGSDYRKAGAFRTRGFLSLWQGTGHPAQLNLGNCFAYAMAKNAQVKLLFNGEDFDKTDTLPAVR